ncbi:FecR domain-containing protein (plasmid) [Ralstonia sp. 25C]|uniref:FecR domain-containing protein n=1 Tax=Ralstonia sp. 25C TaxID=3447363 RepID=UPI003F74E609
MKQPLDDRIAEQAIQWLVLLRSGLASDTDHQRFAAWQEADPAHAAAVQRLQGGLGSLRLPSVSAPHRQAARHLLDTPPSPMRHVRRALVLGGIGAGVAALVDLQIPLSGLGADMRTATAERRDFRLADGSLLRLNARSAVDASVNAAGADVRLRRGNVLAVAASPSAQVRVWSAAGSIECAGGMVCATLEPGGTMRVAVLEGTASVATAAGAVSTVRAGEVRRLSPSGIQPLDVLARSAAAWTRGLVEVEHQPLANVIDALRPYHHGVIELHSDVAGLRVTGRFPLDVHRALQMLAETLPIQVRELAGVWVRIAAR